MREPYAPLAFEWRDNYAMLCGFCDRQLRCDITEGMIAMKEGSPWPEGGWVTDPGAGVTCLSYEPKRGGRTLSRQVLRQLDRTPEAKLPSVCGGCAARKGTEASVALHTQRDYRAAVQDRTVFECHERKGEFCGGWCRAIRRRRSPQADHAASLRDAAS